jgi:hypothetical protein
MIRYAKVYGYNLTEETVTAYLPSNYKVMGTNKDGGIVIFGEDNLGWTLDGYVIPRLGSGGYGAKEVTEYEVGPVKVTA